MPDDSRLLAFLGPLWGNEPLDAPGTEDWCDLLRRIRQPGRTRRVSAEAYRHFRDALPHYHGGDFFASCEGKEPLLLFLHRDGACLCRQLTWDETVSFCELAGIDLPD